MYDTSITKLNSYLGGPYQQAVSSVTNIPNTAYVDNGGWATYGYELWGNKNDRDNSFITWFVNGQPAWTATAAAIGADSTTEISNRLIAEEPMVCLRHSLLRVPLELNSQYYAASVYHIQSWDGVQLPTSGLDAS